MVSSAFLCLGWGWEKQLGDGSYRLRGKLSWSLSGVLELAVWTSVKVRNCQEICKLVDKHSHH